PPSLLIVGGGVEGCEFASLYSALGSRVTIVEMLPRILPLEDQEVSVLLAAELKKQGVTILTGTRVDKVSVAADGVTTTFENGQSVLAAKVLVSIGRGCNTGNLGLDTVGLDRKSTRLNSSH